VNSNRRKKAQKAQRAKCPKIKAVAQSYFFCEFCASLWLIFNDDLGHGRVSGVSQGDMNPLSAQFVEPLLRFSVKLKLRLLSGQANDFHVAPANAAALARAQRFHAGFFGRESRGKMLDGSRLRLAVGDFAGGEQPIEKTFAVTLHRLLESRNFDQVNANADDHGKKIPQMTQIITELLF
jgi:hypothetical protein